MPSPICRSFFISNQNIDIFHNALDYQPGALTSAPTQIFHSAAIVEIERDNRPGCIGSIHAFNDQLAVQFGQCRKIPPLWNQAHLWENMFFPMEVARLSSAAASLRRLSNTTGGRTPCLGRCIQLPCSVQ